MTYTPDSLRALDAIELGRLHSIVIDRRQSRDKRYNAAERIYRSHKALERDNAALRDECQVLRQRLEAAEWMRNHYKAEGDAFHVLNEALRKQRGADHKDNAALRTLLWRLFRWDHMDTAADGTYWRSEIAAALASQPPDTQSGADADLRDAGKHITEPLSAREIIAAIEEDTITDGYSVWSVVCPECGKRTMQVVKPGKVQCSECG